MLLWKIELLLCSSAFRETTRLAPCMQSEPDHMLLVNANQTIYMDHISCSVFCILHKVVDAMSAAVASFSKNFVNKSKTVLF